MLSTLAAFAYAYVLPLVALILLLTAMAIWLFGSSWILGRPPLHADGNSPDDVAEPHRQRTPEPIARVILGWLGL